jgi:O-acetyl-ADP-ribose deacetylase (regulator of RNase III)
MLTYLRTDLFASPAQTLVNAVNTVGVMGKGIAKAFKERYPEMFELYAEHCRRGEMRVGSLMLWRGPEKWVLNFPTKTTWKLPSKLEYVEAGLQRFVEVFDSLGIESASFPPLGCGNGNLDWQQVRPLMEHYLSDLPVPVYIHDCQVPTTFVAEHLEAPRVDRPWTLEGFRQDLLALLEGSHATSDPPSIRHDDLDEAIVEIWATLQRGLLTRDAVSANEGSPAEAEVFRALVRLPYLRRAEIESASGRREVGEALFFAPGAREPEAKRIERASQLSLWP